MLIKKENIRNFLLKTKLKMESMVEDVKLKDTLKEANNYMKDQ